MRIQRKIMDPKIKRIFFGFLAIFYGLLSLVAYLYFIQFRHMSQNRERQIIAETIGQQAELLDNLLRELRQSGIAALSAPNIVRLKSNSRNSFDRITGQRELASFVAARSYLKSAYLINQRESWVYSSDENDFSAQMSEFSDQAVLDLFENQKDACTASWKLRRYGEGSAAQGSAVLSTAIFADDQMALILNVDPASLWRLFDEPNAISLILQNDFQYSLMSQDTDDVLLSQAMAQIVDFIGRKQQEGASERFLPEAEERLEGEFSQRLNGNYRIFSQSLKNSELAFYHFIPEERIDSQGEALAYRILLIFVFVLILTIPTFIWTCRKVLWPFAKSLAFVHEVSLSRENRTLDSFVIDMTKRMAYLRLFEKLGGESDFRLVSGGLSERLILLGTDQLSHQGQLSEALGERLLREEALGDLAAEVFCFEHFVVWIVKEDQLENAMDRLTIFLQKERVQKEAPNGMGAQTGLFISASLSLAEAYYKALVNLQELKLLFDFFNVEQASLRHDENFGQPGVFESEIFEPSAFDPGAAFEPQNSQGKISMEKEDSLVLIHEKDVDALKTQVDRSEVRLKDIFSMELDLGYEELLKKRIDEWCDCLKKYRAACLSEKIEGDLLEVERDLNLSPEDRRKFSDLSRSKAAELKLFLYESFARHFCDKMEKRMKRNRDLTETVKRMCLEELDNPNLSLKLLAARLNLNSEYLGRIFKDTVELSVTAYIKELRMERARRLLEETDWSHRKICEKIGMDNTAYFYTLFRNQFGQTPGEYRKSLNLNEPAADQ